MRRLAKGYEAPRERRHARAGARNLLLAARIEGAVGEPRTTSPRVNPYPVAAVGVAMVAFILIKTGRDAAFFSRGESLRDLPLAYIWIGLVAMPAALMHIRLMRRMGSRRARVALITGAAIATSAFVPFVAPGNVVAMSVFFAFVPVLFAAVFASSWLLAADLLEGTDPVFRRRTYSWIGGASTLGGVTGGVLAKTLAVWMTPRFLVLVGAVVLLVAAWVARRAHRHHPIDDADEGVAVARDMPAGELLTHPFVRLLIGISALAAIAGLLIEFQFYAIATTSGSANTNFFANFYIFLSAASFILQLAVAPLIQSRFGVGGALLVMPIALFGAASAVTVTATIVGRAVLKVTESGLKAAIHRTAWEQAFLPLSREARGRAKALIDGAAARMAEGLTALGLFLWMWLGDVEVPSQLVLSVGTVAVLFGWISLTLRVRRFGVDESQEVVEAVRLPDSCPVASGFDGPRVRRATSA